MMPRQKQTAEAELADQFQLIFERFLDSALYTVGITPFRTPPGLLDEILLWRHAARIGLLRILVFQLAEIEPAGIRHLARRRDGMRPPGEQILHLPGTF